MTQISSLPPRVGRLKAGMAKRDIDVIVSFKPENSFYFTGFNPIIYSHPVIAILTRDHDPIMLVHALRDDHGRASAWVPDIRLYGSWSTKVTMGPNWQGALASILGDLGLAGKTIGLEEEFISIQRMKQLQAALPDAKFTDASHLVDHCRLIKDPDEIAHARIAARVADLGMDTAVATLAAGGNEREVAIASMHEMNKLWAAEYPDVEVADFGSLEGGVQNGMATWVLSGPRMFFNCDNPTQRKPQRGEAVSVLIWTIANGIHAENERTIAMGPLPDANRRALDAILEIRDEVDQLIKPGTPYKDLFEKTRVGLQARGYGANIPGRIGHGIGLGAHEHSSLDAASTLVLEPGMLFTFEPNIRVPGVCATQISDTVLITQDGREYLTRSAGGYLEV
ncbi:Xaa-Pro peptidase family protein [Neorhizobium sp. JUb45]|uniref:M24 family metallopeptidase n=1 Tax=unclassified Neorhizobium TaxID=2629175 RepID=UPI0010510058|nr:Xaa-Pro peptidase family protein [Neorhizobium sp. JUb45]TCR00089.1 Xaa-Pro dipeptidase [Neorhizobium sp. JUb45]